jgi:phage terminase Nu1 subunit (DNA packaging protein)
MLLTTPRRLQQLAQNGIIPRAVRGRYELPGAVQAYVRHLATMAERAEVDGSAVMAARARLLEARAQAAEARRGS